eukprot:TRINITY_DN6053_c0_g1_i1.p1 TRINITY_DN6053_c0_g1~~TRINITY_DN6053_c0_g1_i1.p1  ORF type:complete len:1135 (-),score=357.91 TRINITY_DN6053_c0_g1_i1:140-3544(-)
MASQGYDGASGSFDELCEAFETVCTMAFSSDSADILLGHSQTLERACREANSGAEAASQAPAPVAKGRGKKKVVAADPSAWEDVQVRVIQALGSWANCDIATWPQGIVADICQSLCNTGFLLMAIPANAKNTAALAPLFNMFLANVQRDGDNDHTAFVTSFFDVVLKQESVVSVAALLVEKLAGQNASSVTALMRYIARLDSRELAREGAAAKNLAAFLVELVERAPRTVLSNISLILTQFDGESYNVRSAIVTVIGKLLATAFTDLSAVGATETRDSLLAILQDRRYDVNAYTRGRVMATWSFLCSERLIPLRVLPRVIEQVIERLQDKGAIVRKHAVHFLRNALEYNPYGETLRSAPFQSAYKVCQDAIAEAMTKDPTTFETNDLESLNKLRRQGEFLSSVLEFINQMESATPTLFDLLGSKNSSDIVEVVDFLVVAHQFSLSFGDAGIRKMLTLIFSQETTVKDHVMEAFKRVFLPAKVKDRTEAADYAFRLIGLMNGATVAESESLKTILQTLLTEEAIPTTVVGALWEILALRLDGATAEHAPVAMMLLSMMVDSDGLAQKMPLIVKIGLERTNDLQLATAAVQALQKIATPENDHTRYPASHAMFARMQTLLTRPVEPTYQCAPFAQQAITLAYVLCSEPEQFCDAVMNKLAALAFPADDESAAAVDPSSDVLGQLCFVAGHTAMRQLVLMEEKERVLRNALAAAEPKKTEKVKRSAIEEELGQQEAQQEQSLEDMARMKEEIVKGGVLGRFAPILSEVCGTIMKFTPFVRLSSTLAMCKYMCVSSEYCDANMQLLFTLYENCPDDDVRANISIAIGDLAFRWPSVFDPWCGRIFARLRDKSERVRKHTLMVLTHLILNDMLKVRANVAEMAFCLEDANQRISDLARLFFFELAKKANNPIYNLLPNMLSHLSDSSNVSAETFQHIMKFLLGFIDKEKQTESIVEKLCNRFAATQDMQQWRNIAFCLTLMNFNEKCFKKMLESFKSFQEALHDAEVLEAFSGIIAKGRKSTKAEMKPLLDEIDSRIEQTLHVDDAAPAASADGSVAEGADGQAATGAPRVARTTTTASARGGRKKAAPKGKKTAVKQETLDKENFENDTSAAPARKVASRAATKSRRRVIADSDEDDE